MRVDGFQLDELESKLRSGTLREHSQRPHFIAVSRVNTGEGAVFFGLASCGPHFAEVFVEAMETSQLAATNTRVINSVTPGRKFEFEVPPWEYLTKVLQMQARESVQKRTAYSVVFEIDQRFFRPTVIILDSITTQR